MKHIHHSIRFSRPALIVVFCISLSAGFARANHGPGTSGGGTSTTSGETLKKGKFDLSLRYDYTKFEDISKSEARRLAAEAGEFDSLRDATILTSGLAYGLTDDFQLSIQIGYYWGNDFLDAEAEEGEDEIELGSADPDGLTDLWINGKYRIMKGTNGHLSILGGFKVPTGKDDVKLSNGEQLEPSSQPGTGAWDFQVGAAYSRYLTARVTMDASATYTFRTEHDGFEVGDRLDLGAAVAWRLTESIRKFPNVSLFGETNLVWLGKDDSDEEGKNPNSGGSTLYLSPGLRVRFTESIAFTVAPAFPVWQVLNGEQVESRFKLTAMFSFSF